MNGPTRFLLDERLRDPSFDAIQGHNALADAEPLIAFRVGGRVRQRISVSRCSGWLGSAPGPRNPAAQHQDRGPGTDPSHPASEWVDRTVYLPALA